MPRTRAGRGRHEEQSGPIGRGRGHTHRGGLDRQNQFKPRRARRRHRDAGPSRLMWKITTPRGCVRSRCTQDTRAWWLHPGPCGHTSCPATPVTTHPGGIRETAAAAGGSTSSGCGPSPRQWRGSKRGLLLTADGGVGGAASSTTGDGFEPLHAGTWITHTNHGKSQGKQGNTHRPNSQTDRLLCRRKIE